MTTHRNKLNASDAAAGDGYGSGLSISRDGLVLAVGSQFYESGATSNQGGVYLYDWNGSSWVERSSVLAGTSSNDYFGTGVSLNEDGLTLAVGAPGRDTSASNSGTVYIYDWNGSSWVLRSTITASDAAASDSFGYDVSLSADGSVLVVGAYGWEGVLTNQGGVYTFDWDGSAWNQRGSALFASDASSISDDFGDSVGLSGNGRVLAVGAKLWEGSYVDQGGVYIYDQIGTSWVQRGGVLTAPDSGSEDWFGFSVALNHTGSTVVVGSAKWDGTYADQGCAYVFDWNGSVWVQRGSVITASDTASGYTEFGSGIALSNTGVLAVGARYYDGLGGADQGSVYVYAVEELRAAITGTINVIGLQPAIPKAFNGIATIGTISVIGLRPDVTTRFDGYPTIGKISVIGLQPKIPTPFEERANQSTINVIGLQPSLGSGVTSVTYANVTGYGFRQDPVITFEETPSIEVNGRGFATAPGIYGGAVITGIGFASTLSVTYQTDNTIYVTGQGFATDPSITLHHDFPATVAGRGFASTPAIYGGAVITGRGFSSELLVSAETPLSISVTGRGFATDFAAEVVVPATITITGRGFSSEITKTVITGRGFATQPQLLFEYDYSYAQAFVMNTMTNEVTRYTNYPFIHLAKIGADYYGFTAQGIYQITGTKDVDTAVSTSITTKETDFGVFQSKNVPVVYANSDDHFTLRPIVDGQSSANHDSTFAGRKAKLGRGLKGRYWAFKLDDFQSLQGIELLPEQLQRRVK